MHNACDEYEGCPPRRLLSPRRVYALGRLRNSFKNSVCIFFPNPGEGGTSGPFKFDTCIPTFFDPVREIDAPTLKVGTGSDREVAKRAVFEGVYPYIFQCIREMHTV